MRKRAVWWVGIAIAAMLVAAVAFTLHPDNGPSYDGVPLISHVRAVMRPQGPDAESGVNAFDQLDTNAIPYLLRWIQYEQPAWREKLAHAVARTPPRAVFFPVAMWIARDSRSELAQGSLTCLLMVGNRDLPVAEDLAALLIKNRARPETAIRLITLLGGLGRTDCLPPLLAALKDPEYPYRRTVLSAVEDILLDSNPPASSGVTNELMRCAPELFTNAMNTSSGPAGK